MDAYREPGKRKKVPRKLQSWFIQNADGSEKGPFEYESLVSSGRAERLKPSTLVRPETEAEWRPLSKLLEKEKRLEAKASQAAWSGPSTARADDDPGNFTVGFLAGFLGGCIGLIVVMAFANGDDTKRGVRWGFVFQILTGIVFRIFLAGIPKDGY